MIGEHLVDMSWGQDVDMSCWGQDVDMSWGQHATTQIIGEHQVDMCQGSTRTKLSTGAPIFVPAFMQMEHLQSGHAQKSEKLQWACSRQASSCSTAAPESCSSFSTVAADFSSGLSESEDDADAKVAIGVQEEVKQERRELATPLHASANSWAAGQRSRRNRTEQGEEGLSHEDMTRRIKSILNKLTLEKFPALFTQLVSCGIQNKMHLKVLICEILDKATVQHHFIDMYADLCSTLQAHFSQFEDNTTKKPNFKKLLLDAVQASFEQSFSAPVSLKRLEGDEQRAAEQKYKMQMLGNIKFVGALLVRKMLAVPVMFAIIDELLGDSSPESLEALAAFLTVVGPAFDQPGFTQQFILTAIFDQVDAKTKDCEIKKRIRCLLKDVLELRASGWLDHKPKRLEGPSTLREVAQKVRFEAESSSPSKNHSKSFIRQVSPQSSAAKEQVQSSTHSPATKPASAPQQPSVDLEADQVKPTVLPQQSSTSSEPDQGAPDVLQDLSSEELAEKVAMFIEGNSLDEEAADDLKSCPAEVQRVVLSKGGVTSGRNPSAMLRVRINQAMRKLKLNSKAVERARATRTTSKLGASKTSQPPKKEEKQEACDEQAEKDFDRKALLAIYAELMISHEIQDAVANIAAMAVPTSAQSQELCELLVFIVEKSSGALRTVGFKFIVAIFSDSCWGAAALQEGLQSFARMCDDLKLDVPTLPSILSEELVTCLEPLVANEILPGEHLLALSSAV